MGRSGSFIGEAVRRAGRYGDCVAWTGVNDADAQPKAHPALQHREALLLFRVDVAARHMPPWRQEELELEQRTAGLGSGLKDDDSLAADRILDHLVRLPCGAAL